MDFLENETIDQNIYSMMILLQIRLRDHSDQILKDRFEKYCLLRLQSDNQFLTSLALKILLKHVTSPQKFEHELTIQNDLNQQWSFYPKYDFLRLTLYCSKRSTDPQKLERHLTFLLKQSENGPSSYILTLLEVLAFFSNRLSDSSIRQLKYCPLINQFNSLDPQCQLKLIQLAYSLSNNSTKSMVPKEIALDILHALNRNTIVMSKDQQILVQTCLVLEELSKNALNMEGIMQSQHLMNQMLIIFSESTDFTITLMKFFGNCIKNWPKKELIDLFQKHKLLSKTYWLLMKELSCQDSDVLCQILPIAIQMLYHQHLNVPTFERIAQMKTIQGSLRAKLSKIEQGQHPQLFKQLKLAERATKEAQIAQVKSKFCQDLHKNHYAQKVRKALKRLEKPNYMLNITANTAKFDSEVLKNRQEENVWITNFILNIYKLSFKPQLLLRSTGSKTKSFVQLIGGASPIITFIRTANDCLLACISFPSCKSMYGNGYLLFLKTRRFYRHLGEEKASLKVEKNFINFGNRDIVIERGANKLESEFGTRRSLFSVDSDQTDEIGLTKLPPYTADIASLEIFTIDPGY